MRAAEGMPGSARGFASKIEVCKSQLSHVPGTQECLSRSQIGPGLEMQTLLKWEDGYLVRRPQHVSCPLQ